MIKTMKDMPDGVLGFEVGGKIEVDDYREVVIPALDRAAKAGEVRFVVSIPEFHGITPAAMAEDIKVAVEHFHSWRRLALVSDITWLHHTAAAFRWMIPGDIRAFSYYEWDDALRWVSS